MNFSKKWFSVILLVLMVTGTVIFGKMEADPMDGGLFPGNNSLVLWYTDEKMTDYVESVALKYYEETGVRVRPKCVTGLEYLENINNASVRDGKGPDLYITTNDTLGKAYLAGLASEIQDNGKTVNSTVFPQTAVDAVTYEGKVVGYPFTYETAVFLYNKTYVEEFAKAKLEAEADAATGEAAMAAIDGEGSEGMTDESMSEEGMADEGMGDITQETAETAQDTGAEAVTDPAGLEEKVAVCIPTTIEGILTFAEEYDAPETVESVFKWDVSDIFYNYFFVGNYVSVGGACGDDLSDISIYNEEAISSMKVYQELNQFFSIDADEVTYDTVLQDFLDGKIVFTVATTDAVSRIEEAKANGKFAYEYGITTLPNVNDTILSRGVSVTSAVVVNGYSEKKKEANAFARELTAGADQTLFQKTGKVAARKDVVYDNGQAGCILAEYEKSIPMPKMMETENFWVQLEIAFTRVWTGEDVNATLKSLSEQIKKQISGQAFEEPYIADPVPAATEEAGN